jgi:ribosomal protein S18 acetylase RimI-like enzyme
MLVDLLDGEHAWPLADAARDLYAEVYAEPPYNEGPELVARFVEHFAADVRRDGFSLARAVDGGQLVGVAYGWTMPAGRWWSNATSPAPDEVRDAPKFAIMEWMVQRQHRGAGVGRQLLRLLLADRPEPWATLASHPESAARRIYDRLGWAQVGNSRPSMMPPMDLLALALPAAR